MSMPRSNLFDNHILKDKIIFNSKSPTYRSQLFQLPLRDICSFPDKEDHFGVLCGKVVCLCEGVSHYKGHGEVGLGEEGGDVCSSSAGEGEVELWRGRGGFVE